MAFTHLAPLVSQPWITWRWCPWLSPSHSHGPSVMLHLFSSDMRCHGLPTEPEIIHLRQFYLGNLIHLFIVAILFHSPTLGYVCIDMMYLYIQSIFLPRQPCLATLQQPRWLPSALPIGLFPLVQPHRAFATIHKST